MAQTSALMRPPPASTFEKVRCGHFQLSLGFENENLNAHGTEHPEGYDEFRKEFLELLVKTALKVAEKYPDPEE